MIQSKSFPASTNSFRTVVIHCLNWIHNLAFVLSYLFGFSSVSAFTKHCFSLVLMLALIVPAVAQWVALLPLSQKVVCSSPVLFSRNVGPKVSQYILRDNLAVA